MGEEFKLPASSYEELIKIIKAYGQAKENHTSLGELQKLCGVPSTQISRNSGFLLAVNITEGGKIKVVSEKGLILSRALQHDIPEETAKAWRDIINENDFLTKMVTAIKIRNGMDQQSFQSHIAYSSGQSNNKYVKTGSGTVIDILKIANLISETDGKFVGINTSNVSPKITSTVTTDQTPLTRNEPQVIDTQVIRTIPSQPPLVRFFGIFFVIVINLI